MNIGLIMEHIKNHVNYSVSADELKIACNNLIELSDEEKKWLSDHLPDGMYSSADEVMRVLGWRGGDVRDLIFFKG